MPASRSGSASAKPSWVRKWEAGLSLPDFSARSALPAPSREAPQPPLTLTPQSQLSPKACPPPPGAGARPLGLLRVRGLPSPPTHSQLGGRPPEPFHRPRGRAWGVSRGPRWSKFIITAHCTASVGGSHWTRSGTAAVPNSRGLLPAPHSAPTPRRRRPLPSGDRCLWTPLPFQSRRWARQAFGERRAPRPRGKQRCCYGPRLSPLRQRRGPRHREESRGQPPSVTERRAAGWAPEEAGPEAVARETAVLSRSARPSGWRWRALDGAMLPSGGGRGSWRPGPVLPPGPLEAPLLASLGQGAECLRLWRVSQPSCTSGRLPFVGVSLTCCPTSQGKLLAGNRS